MHPAFSVIFFTAISGAGYGVLFLLAIAVAFDVRLSPKEIQIAAVCGIALTAAGLASSTLHLGQPLRAWRAFSQWRSSWLSREGVASTLTFMPAVAVTLMPTRGDGELSLRMAAAALAAMCVITVFCTARIYTSLRTIRAWHNGYVLPGYFLLALLSGASLFWLIDGAIGKSHFPHYALPLLIFVSSALAVVLKHMYWRSIDDERLASSAESATGLGRFGNVTSAEGPHTEENYLTREMGFVLARKHSTKLRTICLMLIGPIPILSAFATLSSSSETLGITCAVIAMLAAMAGIFVERWLFFAEARHVVMLYYERSAERRA
jgi:sulfite dehydrogenase (quinone) subunit SoeC